MAETIDFGALPHFQHELAAHRKVHEEKTAPVAERIRKFEEFRKRLEPITIPSNLRAPDRVETKRYEVEKRDDGTEVSVVLRTDATETTLVDAVRTLTGGDLRGEDLLKLSYIKDGPLSQKENQPKSIRLGEDDYDIRIKMLCAYAALQTQDGDIGTFHPVLLGSIVDPETILVPDYGDTEHEKQLQYDIIGPDDPRFQPIMATVDHVVEGVAAGGERPRTS